jgi:hypothetical protein
MSKIINKRTMSSCSAARWRGCRWLSIRLFAAVQAHAYAKGCNIHLASGQEKHLPHELGHVVQQAQGRVSATTSVGRMAVNDSPALEHEADMMGAKALRGAF